MKIKTRFAIHFTMYSLKSLKLTSERYLTVKIGFFLSIWLSNIFLCPSLSSCSACMTMKRPKHLCAKKPIEWRTVIVLCTKTAWQLHWDQSEIGKCGRHCVSYMRLSQSDFCVNVSKKMRTSHLLHCYRTTKRTKSGFDVKVPLVWKLFQTLRF